MTAEDRRDEKEAKPPKPALSLKRRDKVILGTAAALLLVGAGVARFLTGYQRVWVVNGFNFPVKVEIDGSAIEVAAEGRESEHLSGGIHHIIARSPAGALLEERDIDVEPIYDAVVYNVLGAAPLYLRSITYSSYSYGKGDVPDAIEMLAGTGLLLRDNVDYVFKDPPPSLQVKQRTGSVTKRTLAVAPGGFSTAAWLLSSKDRLLEASRIVEVAAAASQGDFHSLWSAVNLVTRARGPEAAIAYARELRDQASDVLERHLVYQSLMRWTGRIDEVRDEYRDFYAKNQSSPMAGVLLYRVEMDKDASKSLLDSLVQRFPEDMRVIERAAYSALNEGRHADSAALFAKLAEPAVKARVIDDHAYALVALGRVEEARSLVERQVAALGAEIAPSQLLARAKLARLSGAEPTAAADAVIPRGSTSTTSSSSDSRNQWRKAWVLSAIGEDLPSITITATEEPTRSAVKIQLAAARDPAEAWEACAAADPRGLRSIDPVTTVLLGAEFARAGDMATAIRLLSPRAELGWPASVFLDYVLSGVERPDLPRLAPEIRAALAFVRARRLSETGQTSDDLMALAEKLDAMKGIVSRARERWPKVGGEPAKASGKNAPGGLKKDTKGLKGRSAATPDEGKVLVLVKKKRS